MISREVYRDVTEVGPETLFCRAPVAEIDVRNCQNSSSPPCPYIPSPSQEDKYSQIYPFSTLFNLCFTGFVMKGLPIRVVLDGASYVFTAFI